MRKRFFPLSIRGWGWVAVACSFCAVFGACAVGPSTQQPAAKPPEAMSAYYVGADQLPVYSEPRPSSSLLTQLPLHQKVYRYKLERGYAYIKVEESGITGWVDNAKLLWRAPSSQKDTPTRTREQEARPAQEAPATDKQAPISTMEEKVAKPEPAPTANDPEQKPPAPEAPTRVPPTPSAPAAQPAPRAIDPSIFNPF
jgi:hypothetical protein